MFANANISTSFVAESCTITGISPAASQVSFAKRAFARGLKEDKMDYIAELIDRVLCDPENEENIAAVRKDVNALMNNYPLFAW